MRDFNNLIEKMDAQAEQIDRLEAAFVRMTASRVMDFDKSKNIASSIVILADKLKDFSGVLGGNLDGVSVFKGFLAFLFEKEEELVMGIIADVFDVSREEAAIIPFSCIYECIFKDKVVRDFLGMYANAGQQMQSATLQNAAASHLQHTPSTSKADLIKKTANAKKSSKG